MLFSTSEKRGRERCGALLERQSGRVLQKLAATEALSLQREVYALGLTLGGTVEERAYDAANLAEFLVAGEFDEAKQLCATRHPIRDSLGSDHCAVLDLETYYGRGLFTNPDAINDLVRPKVY